MDARSCEKAEAEGGGVRNRGKRRRIKAQVVLTNEVNSNADFGLVDILGAGDIGVTSVIL